MQVKPAKPITFPKDKSIYAVEGFCSFMNWMCAAVLNMVTDKDVESGKNGIVIDMTVQDSPKIKVVYV